MSAGSFCPSPSSVITSGAVAARTAVAIAVLCPAFVRWRKALNRGKRTDNAASRRGVSSVLASSTTITSNVVSSVNAAWISSSRGARLSASSCTGTTTASAGGPAGPAGAGALFVRTTWLE